ncbi:MAG TPA: efflux RND transporter periplasmic adaptor subunit [Cyclobacteriaceae bacterium]|nr:efflux RND transporter periplasmic adaptor subunit [Cyclobacteriaceae bacterium]
MKTLKLVTLIGLSWIAYACTQSKGNERTTVDTNEIPVWVQKLKIEEVSMPIYTSGQFTTNDETFLSFKTGGIIDRIFVKEGDRIQKGQLLATLNLTEVNAHVSQAELEFEKAKRNYDRVSNLYRDSVATLEQFQNSKTLLDMASKQLETARFNRSYSEIRALTSGHVLTKSASEGQVVAPGSVVLQTNGSKQNDWVLKVGISDREWSRIQLGDNASVSMDALPGEMFMAKVVQKSSGVDSATGTFSAELRLTGALPKSIASGLFGKAIITPSSKQNVWSIPYDALLDAGSQTGFVFVTNDMKTVQKQQVIISAIEKDKVTISSGLETAHYIIIAGSAYLRDNSSIRIIKQ